MAYEMIVMALPTATARRSRICCRSDVYDGFDAAISDRESKGEKVKSTFVGIEKADIKHAEIKGSEAQITLRIVSQMISATYDKADAMSMAMPKRFPRSTISGPSPAIPARAIRTGNSWPDRIGT
jgi:predicted lipid-binding transport protein (Tim44 family)